MTSIGEPVQIKGQGLGILNKKNSHNHFDLKRIKPSEGIDFFVKHYWIIRWDLANKGPFTQEVIPNPCINLVFEKNKTAIFGIKKGKSRHSLSGSGMVIGVKFKPGGFYPFLKRPLSTLTNGSLSLEEAFQMNSETLEQTILSQTSNEMLVHSVENFLQTVLPEPDQQVILLNQMIDEVNYHDDIVTVDQICQHFSINKRSLQRLFNDYVGVGPKWVIKLYRLQQAAEKIEQLNINSINDLAYDLGYYDQAHFIKDFKNFIGKTPLAYSKMIHQ